MGDLTGNIGCHGLPLAREREFLEGAPDETGEKPNGNVPKGVGGILREFWHQRLFEQLLAVNSGLAGSVLLRVEGNPE
jgi:hypothetical protein